MRTALLIGLMIAAGLASGAQAQFAQTKERNPYDPPKAYQGNPYNWDYSKPDPARNGPGYRNVDGSLPTQRQSSSSNSGSYNGYGSSSSGSGSYGSTSRNVPNPACSRPGIVC